MPIWLYITLDMGFLKEVHALELSCCKKWQKSPNQETGLGNIGHMKVLNDTKLILDE